MKTIHIDEFYYTTSEVLCTLYAAFPVRHLLLVEDITGPIKWDMTGLPDKKSTACFETLVWLAEYDVLRFRTIEPGNIGVEGAALTQKAFVLLTGIISWEDGSSSSRIDALLHARQQRAYDDLGLIIDDIFRANCQWAAPFPSPPLPQALPLSDLDTEN
ncbi:MAG: hypothetical protein AB8B57_17110 [Congregibacter sp.]